MRVGKKDIKRDVFVSLALTILVCTLLYSMGLER